MRLKKTITIFLLLMFCISIPIRFSFSNNQYKLGLKERTVLIYEFSTVNTTLLDILAEYDYSYKELSDIPEGFTTKWVINNIDSKKNNWTISANLFTGDNLDVYSGNLQTVCFRSPELFSISVFNSSDVFLDFLPVDVTEYLLEFNSCIPDLFNDTCYINDKSIIFDFRPLGYNDTIIYQYNTQGILEEYNILYGSQAALSRILIKSNRQQEPFHSFIILIIIIISILSLIGFVIIYKYKLKGKSPKKSRTRKYLKHIR